MTRPLHLAARLLLGLVGLAGPARAAPEPPLSALSHDVQRIGEMVGETVLAVLDGQRPPTLEAPPIVFVPRATTGPPVH